MSFLVLLKKLFHLFVYPIIFQDPQTLLEDLRQKHNEENEVRFFIEEASLGLNEFEKELVAGAMKKEDIFSMWVAVQVGRH